MSTKISNCVLNGVNVTALNAAVVVQRVLTDS